MCMRPSLKKLPKALRDIVDELEFASDLIDDCVAIVYVKEPYVLMSEATSLPILNHKELVYFLENAEINKEIWGVQ